MEWIPIAPQVLRNLSRLVPYTYECRMHNNNESKGAKALIKVISLSFFFAKPLYRSTFLLFSCLHHLLPSEPVAAHIFFFFFLRIMLYNVDVHNTHAHSPLWTYVRKSFLYEHLWKIEPADLEIHKVTTDALLSMVTSFTTERIAPIKPRINLG